MTSELDLPSDVPPVSPSEGVKNLLDYEGLTSGLLVTAESIAFSYRLGDRGNLGQLLLKPVSKFTN